MATYLILNGAVLTVACVLAYLHFRRTGWEHVLRTVGFIVLLTLIFDNVIIAAGIVAYDPTKISGIYLGLAPIEDFAYAIVAGLMVPYIWEKLQ